MTSPSSSAGVRRTLWIALLLNLVVATAKLVYGAMTSTLSMLADGLHSFADAGSSVMGLIAVHVSGRPSDQDHHYGHHKFETLAALGIGAFIALTAWEVLRQAIHRLLNPSVHPDFGPGGIPIMLVCMGINLALSRYELRKGREYQSAILFADSYHTASDFWVSATVLLSLVSIRFHFLRMDAILSVVIAIYFAYIAFRLVRDNVLVLSDAAYFDPGEIARQAQQVPGVLRCYRIRTRGKPGTAFADLHIQIDPITDATTSHRIVHQVENRIRIHLPGIREVMVHVEPFDSAWPTG